MTTTTGFHVIGLLVLQISSAIREVVNGSSHASVFVACDGMTGSNRMTSSLGSDSRPAQHVPFPFQPMMAAEYFIGEAARP